MGFFWLRTPFTEIFFVDCAFFIWFFICVRAGTPSTIWPCRTSARTRWAIRVFFFCVLQIVQWQRGTAMVFRCQSPIWKSIRRWRGWLRSWSMVHRRGRSEKASLKTRGEKKTGTIFEDLKKKATESPPVFHQKHYPNRGKRSQTRFNPSQICFDPRKDH